MAARGKRAASWTGADSWRPRIAISQTSVATPLRVPFVVRPAATMSEITANSRRENPRFSRESTVEVEVQTSSGRGRAAVPSGASTGSTRPSSFVTATRSASAAKAC